MEHLYNEKHMEYEGDVIRFEVNAPSLRSFMYLLMIY